jgi:hypothetical protein
MHENGAVMMPAPFLVAPFLVAQHLGQLHAWEQVLVLLLAFGPFILLGIVVVVVRRRDIAEEHASAESPESEGGGS